MLRTVAVIAMVVAIAGVVGMLGLPPVAAQAGPSATRSFEPATVEPGGQVVVTITANNYGLAGGVTETLPEGFTYVFSDLLDSQITIITDQQVRFTLQGDTSFTYTVTASNVEGSHTFSGTLTDFERTNTIVGGDSMVTVEAPAPPPEVEPSATRSFNPATVEPGGRVTVTITANNYGQAGGVTETLPDGFTYVFTSLDVEQVMVTGQQVQFILQGDTSFTYTVTASSVEKFHSFSGTLRDSDRMDHGVDCSSPCGVTVRVSPPPPPPRPVQPQQNRAPVFPGNTATRSVDENSASGASVGARVTASDPDGDTLTYTLTGTDVSSFNIGSRTGQVTVGTGTMLDYETKASYAVTVTATDPDDASDSVALTIMVTNMDEDGVVTITPDTTPRVGTELTAALEDPDGSVANLTWQWQKDDGQGNYADIPGAMAMSYTPVMADEGSRLQATAMYDDGEGSGKEATGMTAGAVGAMPVGDVLSRYDTDGTAGIQKAEFETALRDYIFNQTLDKAGFEQVLRSYLGL